jgi:hypothetical protein
MTKYPQGPGTEEATWGGDYHYLVRLTHYTVPSSESQTR